MTLEELKTQRAQFQRSAENGAAQIAQLTNNRNADLGAIQAMDWVIAQMEKQGCNGATPIDPVQPATPSAEANSAPVQKKRGRPRKTT